MTKAASAKHPRSPAKGQAIGLVLVNNDREVPPAPERIGGRRPRAATIEVWDRFWRSDVAEVVDLESDMTAVLRWIELVDERARAFAAYRKESLVEGSQGQAVLNPMWQVVKACDAELTRLEDRLGMTPKARLQLGIDFAQAGTALHRLNQELDVDADEATELVADPRVINVD